MLLWMIMMGFFFFFISKACVVTKQLCFIRLPVVGMLNKWMFCTCPYVDTWTDANPSGCASMQSKYATKRRKTDCTLDECRKKSKVSLTQQSSIIQVEKNLRLHFKPPSCFESALAWGITHNRSSQTAVVLLWAENSIPIFDFLAEALVIGLG